MKLLKRYRIAIFLSILAVLAFLFRFYLLPSNLFFGPEQGIDFLVVSDIVTNHKLTLIGPKTDIEGIFHGPFYYYIATIPFLTSRGNPLFIAGFLVFLQSLTVFLLYMLGKKLFTQRVGLIAAVLFTVSFEAIVFARWLSGQPLSIPLSCLFFLFLYIFVKGNRNGLVGAAIVFGLLGQVEFINFLLFGGILLGVVVVFRKKFRKQKILFLFLAFLLLLVFSAGTFFIFDLRHEFLISKSMISLITHGSGYYTSLPQSFMAVLSMLTSEFTKTITPFYKGTAFVIVFLGLIILLRSRSKEGSLLVLLWFLVPLAILILLRHSVLEQLFVALIAAIILLAAVVVDKVWQRFPKIGMGLFLFLICLQVYSYATHIPTNYDVFFQATQPNLRYIDQVKVIDAIYEKAHGESFSFQAYTIPYWKQEGWQYLFWYHGAGKPGYTSQDEKVKTLFVIIQRDFSNYQEDWLKNQVEKWGMLEDVFQEGILEVRKLKREV